MTQEAPYTNQLRILAVDDDAPLLALYQEALHAGSQGNGQGTAFDLETCGDGNSALHQIRASILDRRPFAMVFLDLNLGAGPDGITIGKQIRAIDESINFVIVTGLMGADAQEIAQKVPPADKLLFVQKPLHVQEIRQFAEAMGAKWRSEHLLRETNTALKLKVDELESSQQALMEKKGELEYANNQLLETNNALSVLARNLENTRKESEKQVLRKTRTLIIPTIKKLKLDHRLARYRTDLDLLEGYVDDLTSDISEKTRNAEALSATESRIASMIRLGMTSADIANHLCVSVSTVKTHRKNIRRKLKLKNTGTNLRSYLESRLGADG
jgi:DNA-binding CsgD family transcriptional regulator/DNA-binding response OmpR family regulator